VKIYSMTATFGKLENQVLNLQPGLNIIHRPNEWGKSTWCSFLAIMLYGLETRAKNTKIALADKERYAPWSGAAMAGRMDVHWQGRDITIERYTKGRTPMGEFKAYETQTGLPVPELTAANCGEKLLGVERSVFLRAGFLRLSDLPVTQDDSLRRRLNALVTTGDESSDGDRLAQSLKGLKNKVRYNRSGLLPQAEAEQNQIEQKLTELRYLAEQTKKAAGRQQELETHIAALENHKAWLAYHTAEENRSRVAAAQAAEEHAAQQVALLQQECETLPDAAQAGKNLETLKALQQRQLTAQMDAGMLPPLPQEPPAPMCFYGLDGAEARQQVQADISEFEMLTAPQKKSFPLWVFGIPAAIIGIVLLVLQLWIPGGALLAVGAALLFAQAMQSSKAGKIREERLSKAETIRSRYGGGESRDWQAAAELFAQRQEDYRRELEACRVQRQRMEANSQQLKQDILQATEGRGLPAAMEWWEHVLDRHAALEDALRNHRQMAGHAQALQAVAQTVPKPELADPLLLDEAQTDSQLYNARFELKQKQTQQAQYQGRMETLGSEKALELELQKITDRIAQLRRTYVALETAQEYLDRATQELQRRFAPRISKEAQRIFGKLTGGRYDRLTLSQDLSVNAGTAEETVLRSAMWRSEGTVDQLYLSLRLAVAKELTPDAPLVLDDALVRFDDVRHAAAMEVLRQEAENKQIILFTCQKRELDA
jgi:uncharacterized protein YhaN